MPTFRNKSEVDDPLGKSRRYEVLRPKTDWKFRSNVGGGTNDFNYLGTPSANYALDRATSLTPPINWMPQTTNTASIGNVATAGYLMFTNSNHLPQGYYRTRLIP